MGFFRPTLLFPLLSLLSGGCVSVQPGNAVELHAKPGEVIVVGRLEVGSGGEDVAPATTIFFNGSLLGGHPYRPDDSGYIYMKLKNGENYLSRVEYDGRFAVFPKDRATVTLTDTTSIHYIGDIRLELSGNRMIIAGSSGGGMLGSLQDEIQADRKAGSGNEISVQVYSDPERSIGFIQRRFPHSKKIVTTLMKVKAFGRNMDTTEEGELLEPVGR